MIYINNEEKTLNTISYNIPLFRRYIMYGVIIFLIYAFLFPISIIKGEILIIIAVNFFFLAFFIPIFIGIYIVRFYLKEEIIITSKTITVSGVEYPINDAYIRYDNIGDDSFFDKDLIQIVIKNKMHEELYINGDYDTYVFLFEIKKNKDLSNNIHSVKK